MEKIIKETVTTENIDDDPRTLGLTSNPGGNILDTLEYLIYFLFGILEILLVFRFFFKMTGANSSNIFVGTIYNITQYFVSPFAGIFPTNVTNGVTTAAVFEPATIIAIVVYGVLVWAIVELLRVLTRNQTTA